MDAKSGWMVFPLDVTFRSPVVPQYRKPAEGASRRAANALPTPAVALTPFEHG
jgi:hypothetical protein